MARADTRERKLKREQFIQELIVALPIYPVTTTIALRVGQIDGASQSKGIRLPLADLLIGVTALELGYRGNRQSAPLPEDFWSYRDATLDGAGRCPRH